MEGEEGGITDLFFDDFPVCIQSVLSPPRSGSVNNGLKT